MHAVDEEDEDTVDGDEDEPRRASRRWDGSGHPGQNCKRGSSEKGCRKPDTSARLRFAMDGDEFDASHRRRRRNRGQLGDTWRRRRMEMRGKTRNPSSGVPLATWAHFFFPQPTSPFPRGQPSREAFSFFSQCVPTWQRLRTRLLSTRAEMPLSQRRRRGHLEPQLQPDPLGLYKRRQRLP